MYDFLAEQVCEMGDNFSYFYVIRQTEGYFAFLYRLCFIQNDLFGFNSFFSTLSGGGSLGKIAKRVLIFALLDLLFGC